jgi:signal transduction histidine kinase
VDVAYSLRNTDWLQGVVRWLLMVALLPGALGAALAGWLIARSIASRVEGVGRELRAVSASRLGERVQLPGGNDEIGQMAADINAMLDRLASTFRGMEQFMSEVSHELKTPVAALLAEAQVMKYSEPSPETSKQFISGVEEEMRRLGKLVESFLMLARFEHGRRFLAEGVVPVNDVVLESVEHSSRMASQAAVRLSLQLYDPGQSSPEALVRGDAELLRIVFDNLIRNAVQFSDRNSTVSVGVGLEDRTVTIDVRDRGPGAPPDYINKIFERFTQAPTQKPGRRGTGLGLAIAKGVVELHSGTIHARNHPEGGCVFTVRLPLLLRPAVDPSQSARAAAASVR